jgi:hypothetical protein
VQRIYRLPNAKAAKESKKSLRRSHKQFNKSFVSFSVRQVAGRDRRSSSARTLCESSTHGAQMASDGQTPAIGTSRRPQNEHRSALSAADSRLAGSARHDSQM